MSSNEEKWSLREQADLFRRTDLYGKVDDSRSAKYLLKILFFLTSLAIGYFLKTGFSDTFISFGSAVLAIFVGLFITALLFSFDKFYRPPEAQSDNSQQNIWDTQGYQYTRKFFHITGQTIVLCINAIGFLAISALFPAETRLNIFTLEWKIYDLSFEAVCLFFLAAFVVVQRVLVLYWSLWILYSTLFVVRTMVEYMATKIKKQDDSN